MGMVFERASGMLLPFLVESTMMALDVAVRLDHSRRDRSSLLALNSVQEYPKSEDSVF